MILKIIIIVAFFISSVCGIAGESFPFKRGVYRIGHPAEDAIFKALRKSSVRVHLSWHHGISLPAETGTGKGWENKMTITRLKERLEKIKDKQQGTILIGKNYQSEQQLEEKVVAIMKKLGFKTIVVQGCYSQGIIIVEVIKNKN